MRPHLDKLLAGIVIPILRFTEKDLQLWKDDPQEYIRKEFGESPNEFSDDNRFGRRILQSKICSSEFISRRIEFESQKSFGGSNANSCRGINKVDIFVYVLRLSL